MTTTNLSKAELAEVVRKIHALRRVTKTTGFITGRTIGDILSKLSPDDLVAVGETLDLREGEVKHLNASGVRPNFGHAAFNITAASSDEE